jgi:hypothetical protein
MSLFGQVWLWSLLAFVIGALVTWLVLARPARKRVRELERRLTRAHAEASRAAEPMEPTNTAYLAQPTAVEQEPYTPPERYGAEQASTEQVSAEQTRTELGFVEDGFDQSGSEQTRVEPADAEQHTQQYSTEQYSTESYSTEPYDDEPYTLVNAQPEHNRHAAVEPEAEVWTDEPVAEYETDSEPDTGDFLPPTEYLPEVERELEAAKPEPSLFQPEPTPADYHPDPDWFERELVPARSPFEEPSGADSFQDAEVTQVGSYEFGSDVEEQRSEPPAPVDATQILPKRQPRQSPLGGFDPPQPIQPSMRAIERREPNSDLSGVHSGSLFEPAIEPGTYGKPPAPEPPPARDPIPSDSVPPGPFGPGSAMPRPGGGSPADDFTVKASVTALRYCTGESPQFSRMVAEVWFRTPEDAERVGFRPLA